MITEEQAELIIEKLVNRIQTANVYFLKNIGESLKKIRLLKPSEAQQLIQILKYGGNYDEIVREIRKYTNLNIQDIDNIFNAYAKKDRQFSKEFYEYKNIPFVESEALKTQRIALTNLAKTEMYNFTRTNVLGYVIRDIDGNLAFSGLKETYNRVLDEALLYVSQGKETFDSAMARILNDIGGSGLKTLNYESGRAIRLDSAVRMHLQSRLRELHNENQKIIAEEIKADGVEISTHFNPAPDHALIQGRQLKNKQFEKLQKTGKAKTYDGIDIDLHLELKNGQTAEGFRPISEYNCYHYVFSVILGINKPEHTNSELNEIMIKNENGFYLYDEKADDFKHYTMYDGSQMMRNLERRVREQKDKQILGKSSGNNKLIAESQQKITQLTRKYKELSKISGLKTRMDRMRVATYRRVAIKK